jgi:hypothetical protein
LGDLFEIVGREAAAKDDNVAVGDAIDIAQGSVGAPAKALLSLLHEDSVVCVRRTFVIRAGEGEQGHGTVSEVS